MHGNSSDLNAEYAQLKGDYDALHHASIMKKCDLAFANDLANTVKQPIASTTNAVAGSHPAAQGAAHQ